MGRILMNCTIDPQRTEPHHCSEYSTSFNNLLDGQSQAMRRVASAEAQAPTTPLDALLPQNQGCTTASRTKHRLHAQMLHVYPFQVSNRDVPQTRRRMGNLQGGSFKGNQFQRQLFWTTEKGKHRRRLTSNGSTNQFNHARSDDRQLA